MRIFILVLCLFLGACASDTKVMKKSLRMTAAVASKDVELVFDKKYDTKTPVQFRKSEELRMSGSGTFSQAAAKTIAKVAEVVLVVDLRQESHGLINDKPVTWESDKDWANAGMNVDEVIQREKRFLSEIHIGAKFAGGKIRAVETEESLIRSFGQSYLRLAVTEHLRPSNAQVDRFIEAIRDMPPNSWVHFHDRDGKGRSTTFMIMYDMLRSAWDTGFDAIIQRNTKLSHDEDVMAIAEEGDWRRPYQQDRVAFLVEFYNYAKAHPNGDGLWWSGWAN